LLSSCCWTWNVLLCNPIDANWIGCWWSSLYIYFSILNLIDEQSSSTAVGIFPSVSVFTILYIPAWIKIPKTSKSRHGITSLNFKVENGISYSSLTMYHQPYSAYFHENRRKQILGLLLLYIRLFHGREGTKVHQRHKKIHLHAKLSVSHTNVLSGSQCWGERQIQSAHNQSYQYSLVLC
jgi:hypothetical protein